MSWEPVVDTLSRFSVIVVVIVVGGGVVIVGGAGSVVGGGLQTSGSSSQPVPAMPNQPTIAGHAKMQPTAASPIMSSPMFSLRTKMSVALGGPREHFSWNLSHRFSTPDQGRLESLAC